MSAAPDLSGFTKDEIMAELQLLRHPVEIACFGTDNHFNFGAIIRTAHCFLARKMYAIDIEWYYKKAAMTALKWEKQNIIKCSLNEFLEQTKDRNIVAFERRPGMKSEDIRTFSYPDNPILLFGNEREGVPDILLERADHICSIPCFGFVNDLNISVAAGIALNDFITKYTMGH